MKKIVVKAILFLTVVQFVFTNSVMASELEEKSTYIEIESSDNTRREIIEMRFRIYKGIRQYRRWNVSRKCWLDTSWINMN